MFAVWSYECPDFYASDNCFTLAMSPIRGASYHFDSLASQSLFIGQEEKHLVALARFLGTLLGTLWYVRKELMIEVLRVTQ